MREMCDGEAACPAEASRLLGSPSSVKSYFQRLVPTGGGETTVRHRISQGG